jgi:PIN domain nuclease of toxin-antitoxin system
MGGVQEVILLDIHTLIWMSSDPSKLSTKARDAIQKSAAKGGIAVSAITLWELAWLATNNRLSLTGTVSAFLEKITSRTAVRPITIEIAVLANQFPASFPADPCDRLIGATALSEGMVLVTKDRDIRRCNQLQTVW